MYGMKPYFWTVRVYSYHVLLIHKYYICTEGNLVCYPKAYVEYFKSIRLIKYCNLRILPNTEFQSSPISGSE